MLLIPIRLLPQAGVTSKSMPKATTFLSQTTMTSMSIYKGNLLLLNKIVVRDENGALLRELKTPAAWLIHSACWMGANHILIASEKWQSPQPQSDIYRYSLGTDEITQLTNHPSRDQSPDWISETPLSVSPLQKKKISWGILKTQEEK